MTSFLKDITIFVFGDLQSVVGKRGPVSQVRLRFQWS
ncbi:unnamed protein product [Haemonchus placei]|uniref:Uncharacterized protein n=1 Tax=Haemonchus placei TaxID=6290 RepID=A0A3P7TH75_HAEPC|nr:unnamed protein product [Haemonchus placei]